MTDQHTPRILVKLPSLNRPHLLRNHLPLWCTGREVQVLLTLNTADTVSQDAALGLELPGLTVARGQWANKIEAFNGAMFAAKPWEILITAGDDYIPTSPLWDEQLRVLWHRHFSLNISTAERSGYIEDLDVCLHLPDGIQDERLMTHPIVGRDYYDRFGYLIPPWYKSEWADNEAQDVARVLGRYRYLPNRLFTHAWASVTGRDATFRKSQADAASDKAIYERRKTMGFPA